MGKIKAHSTHDDILKEEIKIFLKSQNGPVVLLIAQAPRPTQKLQSRAESKLRDSGQHGSGFLLPQVFHKKKIKRRLGLFNVLFNCKEQSLQKHLGGFLVHLGVLPFN